MKHEYRLDTKFIKESSLSKHSYVNPPIQKASTALYKNVTEMTRSLSDRLKVSSPVYGRFGTPTAREFEYIISSLEMGFKAICTCSGLSAITSAVLAFIQNGDHILISDSVYLPTRNFCNSLSRFGVMVEYYDPCIGYRIGAKFKPNTRLVYMESPGSSTFEVQDVPAIAKLCKQHNILSIIDNTWPTPVNLNPIPLGVNVVIHSCTKYITGHSDSILGVIISDKESYEALRTYTIQSGQCAGNEDIYSAILGLRTLSMRLKFHQNQAIQIAQWLSENPLVSEILYPALADHGQHGLWKRDFRGASGVFSFLLSEHISKESLDRMLNKLKVFGLGHSWGGHESLLIPVDDPKSYRLPESWKKSGWLMRISLGFEDIEDLKQDLEQAFLELE